MIGNDVTVTVLGVKGNQVRIGVNAPRDVAVHREEIYERINGRSRKASRASPVPATATARSPDARAGGGALARLTPPTLALYAAATGRYPSRLSA